ncbi:methyltransferase [Erythrobacter sp.]|uniref:methyltransferase n=1 Tax=Erythrobacter sp. TaxID=1042 RepID=UPI002E9C38C7|nr:methyltransferase [Erythrobacter sp.]
MAFSSPPPARVPQIFARSSAKAKWARARDRLSQQGSAAYLHEALAEEVGERLAFMRFDPARALIVGDATGQLAARMPEADLLTTRLGEFDEEAPWSAEPVDLAVHLMGLGVVNDLPGALIHARHALRGGGLFVSAFPGAGSCPALRAIALAGDGDRPAPRMHPLVDNRAATGLLQRAGFARQVVDTFAIRVRFSSLGSLVSDLRDVGLTRSLATSAPPLDRAWLARAEAAFDELRGEDGKVTETFEILVLTGWR